MNFNNFIFQDPIEMIAVLQAYIAVRKDVTVVINTNNLDINKLTEAYNIAIRWFEYYNTEIVIIR